MQPFLPSGPGHTPGAFQALFRRNALQPPELARPVSHEEAVEPEDEVELSKERDEDENQAKDAQSSSKAHKALTYHPALLQMAAPRAPRPNGGWILSGSKPKPKGKGKEMQEQDLSAYSRWHSAASEPTTLEEFLGSSPSGPQESQLLEVLRLFGQGVLDLFLTYGLVLNWIEGSSSFFRQQRCLEVGRGDLQGREAWGPLLRAIASAYDDALGDGQPASASSLAVLAHVPHGQSAQHFFAQSLADYLQSQLAQDAGLYGYLDYLIVRSRQCPGTGLGPT